MNPNKLKLIIASEQRLSLAQYKVATENAAKYLIQLNLQKILKDHPPRDNQDKKVYYKEVQEEAKKGPIFNFNIIRVISELPIDLDKIEIKWYANILQKEFTVPNRNILQGILDWSRATHTRLDKQSFEEAAELSEEWHNQFQAQEVEKGNYKTKNIIHKFPDGYTLVKVTDHDDLKLEGELMGHCVGGYCHQVDEGKSVIISLRDPKNRPHVTIEVNPSGNEIIQVQGKQNKPPKIEYQRYIFDWLLHSKYDLAWLELLEYDGWEIINEPKYKEIVTRIKETSPYYMYKTLAHGGTVNNEIELINKIIDSKDAKVIVKLFQNYWYSISTYIGLEEKSDPMKTSGLIKKATNIIIESKDPYCIYEVARILKNTTEYKLLGELEKAIIETKDPTYCRMFAQKIYPMYGDDVEKLLQVVIDSGNMEELYHFCHDVSSAEKFEDKIYNATKNLEDEHLLIKFMGIKWLSKQEILKKIFSLNNTHLLVNVVQRGIRPRDFDTIADKLLNEGKPKDLLQFFTRVHADNNVIELVEDKILETKDTDLILNYCTQSVNIHNKFDCAKFNEYFSKINDMDTILAYTRYRFCGPVEDRNMFINKIVKSKDPDVIESFIKETPGIWADRRLQKALLETNSLEHIYGYAVNNYSGGMRDGFALEDEFRKAVEKLDTNGTYLKSFNIYFPPKEPEDQEEPEGPKDKEAGLRVVVSGLRRLIN